MIFSLAAPLALAGCGEAGPLEDAVSQAASDFQAEDNSATYETVSMAIKAISEEGIAGSAPVAGPNQIINTLCAVQDCPSDIEENILKEYRGYTLVFTPDDFAPEEIVCDNVFSDYQNGRENPEILGLYEKVKEQWEYLYYVEYDLDGDGEETEYIVLHCNPGESGGEKFNICGGDIWYQGVTNYQKTTWLRQELPKTSYLIGGTWEEPELYMMLLEQSHSSLIRRSFAVYQDYEARELAVYGCDGKYERVMARSVMEEVAGAKIKLTGYQTLHGYPMEGSGVMPVRLEITKEGDSPYFEQVILADRVRVDLTAEGTSCTVWDGNNDGHEDILYYGGFYAGSGGCWDAYYLLCWSEEEQRYIKTELPPCTFIDYEGHKLYSYGNAGASQEFYEIYGLRDGEYRLEKNLDILYGVQEENFDRAIYSEYGEEVEEIRLPDMDFEEQRKFFSEKYPEFLYYWQ